MTVQFGAAQDDHRVGAGNPHRLGDIVETPIHGQSDETVATGGYTRPDRLEPMEALAAQLARQPDDGQLMPDHDDAAQRITLLAPGMQPAPQ